MISKEDMEALSSYEYYFKSAINSNYCRSFSGVQYRALKEIYFRITGRNTTHNLGCPHCAIKFIRELGRLYFDELEKQKAQIEPEPEAVTDSVPKKKGGRPKKQATNKETKNE